MVAQQQAHGAAAASPATPAAIPPASVPMRWTEEAMLRLERVPAFVRNMARSGIEEFARSQGLTEVTGEVMDAARQKFGM
ncbi:MAG: PCP reductase family protein [Planctomycetes bacterium]|nr:PCP reductase family protein [Planctomycetota bacterium]